MKQTEIKKYDTYKKTDEAWLTAIPDKWNLRKMKYLFSERNERNFPNESLLAATQNKGVVPKSVYGQRTVTATKDFETLKLVKIDDFVISLRSFQGGIEKAYYQGIISPAYTVLISNGIISSNYFKYLAKSAPFIKLLQLCVTGIREGQNIDYFKLKNNRLPIPSHDEQNQIVRFLDWQTYCIDKLIRAKKQEIALLNEQKQVVINKAVTKGIDENVPMKDSGVEWIGKIPETWEKIRIGSIFTIVKRIACKEGYQVLSVTQRGIKIKDITKNEGQMAMNYSKYQFVYPGDYIMNHMDLITGFVDCSQYMGVTSPDYRVFSLNKSAEGKYNKSFLLRLLQLCYYRRIFYGLGHGAAKMGRWRLPAEEFLKFEIPVPASSEKQTQITNYIDSKVKIFDQTVESLTSQLSLLAEYRTRLTSDVVTGQIDVRGIQVPDVPTESEETESEETDDENGEPDGAESENTEES